MTRPELSADKPSPSRRPLWAKAWDPIRRSAIKRFPAFFFRFRVRESLAWYHKKDAEANEATTPDGDESIQVHCLWAVEFYTPGHADALASAFSDLGWDSPRQENNPSSWLKNARTKSDGGGWINVGIIRRSGNPRLAVWPERIAPLPGCAEHAQAHLFNLTSSLTCMVVQFQLNERYRDVYERALRRTYVTRAKPVGTGFSFSDPYFQKREAIDDARNELRNQLQKWFLELMPGIFSSNLAENEFPICEFITFKKAEPFADTSQGKKIDEYLSILDTRGDWNSWTADELPGLKFTWPTMRGRDEFYAIAAIQEKNLSKIDLKLYGDTDAGALIAKIDLQIKTLLCRCGCIQLLDSFERRLNMTRDEKSFRTANKNSLKLLNQLRSLISESVDIASMTRELESLASEPGLFDHEIPDFKMSGRHADSRIISLKSRLRGAIAKKSKRLPLTDRAVKDALIQQGNLASAIENIKLQRRIAILTIILTVLTIVMAYEPIAKLLK